MESAKIALVCGLCGRPDDFRNGPEVRAMLSEPEEGPKYSGWKWLHVLACRECVPLLWDGKHRLALVVVGEGQKG